MSSCGTARMRVGRRHDSARIHPVAGGPGRVACTFVGRMHLGGTWVGTGGHCRTMDSVRRPLVGRS